MRAFIAIELPQEVKELLGRLQAKLKTAGADVKWVETKNIHLTLKFLGEIDDPTLARIIPGLEEVSRKTLSFDAALSSVGAFPGSSSPRIIWAGIAQGDIEVKNLARAVEERLSAEAIPKEDREFSSHITIGRTRSSRKRQELAKLLLEVGSKPLEGNFPVSKITIFKSTLSPKGPTYEMIRKFDLANR